MASIPKTLYPGGFLHINVCELMPHNLLRLPRILYKSHYAGWFFLYLLLNVFFK